jgi:hypothetical protein
MLKLRSKTDVITNSSSEVFIIKKEYIKPDTFSQKGIDEREVEIRDIDQNFFLNEWEEDNITSAFGLPTVPTGPKANFEYYLRRYKKELDEIFGKYCFVEIEDHYSEWRSDTDTAHDLCIWSESRH